MKRKAYVLYSILMLLLMASCLSIVNVSSGSQYVMAAGEQSIYRLDVAKSRGLIYDCNQKPLVGANKKLIAAVAPSIESIGALEQATGGEKRELLGNALKNGKPFFLELDTAVQHNGIDLFRVPERYADDQLAPHVVGYLDSMGSGVAGVELAMDDVLANHSGEISVSYRVDALGRTIAGADRNIVNTISDAQGGVVLTLDTQIQKLAEKAAEKLGEGAVVVTEVPNCEIRALVSMPDYTPGNVGAAAKDTRSPLLNRAFSAYAPGSVFKLVTAAWALESGINLGTYNCTGAIDVEGLAFHCIDGKAHGTVNLQTALEKSCNCFFINAAHTLGGQVLLTTAYNLGFGVEEEFGRGLLTEAGLLPEASALQNARTLANFAIGQGDVSVTPVQMAGMLNVIASGGSYTQPKLIAGVLDEGGELTPHQPITDKTVEMLSAKACETLQRYMAGVVKNGTGIPGAPEACTAGAKTGTAQTGVFEGSDELMNFWYCGFIEDENGPRYCITVLRDGATDDNGAAAQVFREIADGLAERMQ